MNTIEVLSIIGQKNPEIMEFYFHYFPKQVLLQDRMQQWDKIDQNCFENALLLRKQWNLPFWDSIMLQSFDNPHYSRSILEAATFHNHILRTFTVKSTQVLQYPIIEQEDMRLAICSKVRMKDNSYRYICMLDFHIPISNMNLQIVEEICTILKLGPGFILNSGESYHFIALYTQTWEEQYMVLSKSLLFCPIIDRAWISHQLQEKVCSLRVGRKNGIETKVIKLIR